MGRLHFRMYSLISETMVLVTIFFLLTSRSILAEEKTTNFPDKNLEKRIKTQDASDGRLFDLSNLSTMNSGTLSGLALLGFAGIAVISLIVPFLMSAFGLAIRPEMFGLRRSFGDIPWTNDWLRRYGNEEKPPPAILVMRLFNNLGVEDTECQKLIVCEVQRHPVTKSGTIGNAMSLLFSHPYSDNEIDLSLYKHLHEAWKRGTLNEDCTRIYPGCRMFSNNFFKRLA